MSEPTDKRSYKDTLNLPKTSFAMKANLVQREPEFQKRWEKLGLYPKLRKAGQSKPRFILHDGPPYANGAIHLGHLLNKVMKDLVVRSRSMLGYDAPFIPGWDCHGLPIEHKVMQERQGAGDDLNDRISIRRACKKYAEKFIKLQAAQMQRLGTIGDYENPYLTMAPDYEAATLEVFADLVGKGLVYRQLKPVHWSIENRTALAEAELEYEDRQDTSVYVLFQIDNPQDLPAKLMARPGDPLSLMIWTTTPWTLPANLAVAAGPNIEYGLYRFEVENKQGVTLLATSLAEKIMQKVGTQVFTQLGACSGAELEKAGVRYRHPFLDRTGPVVTAEYVSTEDGTGLVHTAPGHGVEDYQTGLKHKLDIYCPVQEDGTFDTTAPDWLHGQTVWQGNALVVEKLRESGHLVLDEKFNHSYPHDWRSKTPVIFRATEQWFVGVDKPLAASQPSIRSLALAVTKNDVNFFPEWGRNRMRGMLESRPDWCLSRQRAWGLPIPAFFGPEKGQVLLTAASVRAVAAQFRKHGSDVWFKASAADLLAEYDPANDPDAPQWLKTSSLKTQDSRLSKSHDIFDVWFESGSSWNSVIRQRFGNEAYPVDLYLEGSDQHRGWFQLSLLPALGVTGQAPFKAVLTHGFMVDKFGRKMSKSEGNALEVEALLKEYGADVCRWWVCSLNSDNDIKADVDFFRLAGEEYRKVRNTIRFLLSNLGDFDAKAHRRALTDQDACTLDAWAHDELQKLIAGVRNDYEHYRYKRVHDELFKFCNETLSAVYLAATKDRLYCDKPDSDRRRRTQTVMHDIAQALILLVAPVLVHTADEAWMALHRLDNNTDDCVHLHELPQAGPESAKGRIAPDDWSQALALRDRVLKAMEDARAQRGLDNPLDTGVEAAVAPELYQKLRPFLPELADLHGVSRFALVENGTGETIAIEDLRNEPRCERSWKRDGTVKQRSDGGLLTDRDADAVGV